MESNFEGLVIDPSKCNMLSLEEKRELVHEIARLAADNAPEILQSWGRRDLLELICAEMGKERKYTGVTKPKMIDQLLRLVSDNSGQRNTEKEGLSPISPKRQTVSKKKRKKENHMQCVTDIELYQSKCNTDKLVDILICENLVCRATLSHGDKYCKRCSCCICYHYDDNKDPSLWLVCNSDPPFRYDSCGMSCHLKCAMKHEKAGILRSGSYSKLDGSFYCVCCGKVNWLIGSWLKQVLVAKDARRVDVLCNRLSLSHKILKGTERYKDLHSIVNAAVNKLKKEVGPLDKVSAVMARGIVNRLACGAEVQKLCVLAVETVGSMVSGTSNPFTDSKLKSSGPQVLRIRFEDISSSSVVVLLDFRDDAFYENIIGCTMWHRTSDARNYPKDPTCIVLRPDSKVKVAGLGPSTEYYFKVSLFSCTKEIGKWEARCITANSGPILALLGKGQRMDGKMHPDSHKGSMNSSDNNRSPKLSKSHHKNRPKVLQLERISDNSVNHFPPMKDIVPYVSSASVPPETPCKDDRHINSLDSANKKETAEREYEYCVKVIRWLECEGYMEKEFRVKFLTWFSLKSTARERRVVSAFIDVLIDEPECLVAQLIDAFMDGICNKEKQVEQKGIQTRLWH